MTDEVDGRKAGPRWALWNYEAERWDALPDGYDPLTDSRLAAEATTSSIDQPPPTPNELPKVWAMVIDDMAERDAVGLARYGTPLQPFNGRDALKDAYAEALDLVVYLRQAIYERDGR